MGTVLGGPRKESDKQLLFLLLYFLKVGKEGVTVSLPGLQKLIAWLLNKNKNNKTKG